MAHPNPLVCLCVYFESCVETYFVAAGVNWKMVLRLILLHWVLHGVAPSRHTWQTQTQSHLHSSRISWDTWQVYPPQKVVTECKIRYFSIGSGFGTSARGRESEWHQNIHPKDHARCALSATRSLATREVSQTAIKIIFLFILHICSPTAVGHSTMEHLWLLYNSFVVCGLIGTHMKEPRKFLEFCNGRVGFNN